MNIVDSTWFTIDCSYPTRYTVLSGRDPSRNWDPATFAAHLDPHRSSGWRSTFNTTTCQHFSTFVWDISWKCNYNSPWKFTIPKRKVIFQPSFFNCHVGTFGGVKCIKWYKMSSFPYKSILPIHSFEPGQHQAGGRVSPWSFASTRARRPDHWPGQSHTTSW